jgi:hypothetical protein
MPNISAIMMERGIGAIEAGEPPGFVANALERQVSAIYHMYEQVAPSGAITDLVRSGWSRVMSKKHD